MRSSKKRIIAQEFATRAHFMSSHGGMLGEILNPEEVEAAHDHDHTSPGGIRHHPISDRSWLPEKVETVRREIYEMDGKL